MTSGGRRGDRSTAEPVQLEEEIERLFGELGESLDAAKAASLARYLRLLVKWSSRIDLTGARDPLTAADRLLLDAPVVARVIPIGSRVLDVGAGAGGLSIALALLRCDLRLRLVEARSRRAAFLRTARRELELASIEVVEGRAEALTDERADVALSRAAMRPAAWLELATGLVRPGGIVLCLSARPLDLSHVPPALTPLPVVRYRLPLSSAQRMVSPFTLGPR